MSFPRFHITTVPNPLLPAVHGAQHHLQAPALLGALAGLALAVAGLLVNAALAPGVAGLTRPSQAQVIASVSAYINQWQPDVDPLITIEGVGQVKASNIQGVEVAGRRYYYRMVGAASFDPVSQGKADRYRTVALLDEGTAWAVEIYELE